MADTKVATPDADLEARQAEEKAAKVRDTSHKAAESLVQLFDDKNTTFKRAKAIAKALDAGADLQIVADELSILRARKYYSDASAPDQEFYATTAPSKGGVMVPKSTISAYDGAWRSVQRAGLVPTEETVDIAFKVLSKGRTAQPRKQLEVRIAELVEETEDATEGARQYVLGAREILTGRLATPARPRPEGNNKSEEDVEPTSELAEGVPMSVEVAIHNLKVILGQPWNDDEFAVIAASVEELLEAHKVEV